jgi:hypothetical protein
MLSDKTKNTCKDIIKHFDKPSYRIQSNQCFTILYTDKAKLPKKYLKLSLSADLLSNYIICTLKIRRAPTRHDYTIDFQPLIIRTSTEVLPVSVTVADKAYIVVKVIMF